MTEEDKPYRLLQDNGSKYFGPSWDKADKALNKPQKRPQNCGTGYCSCIECVMEPAQRTWVGLTDEEFQMIYDMGRTPAGMMEMVEAKLKEKNT